VNDRGEKIQKVLAAAGICSRRQAENLIRRGLVRVNGELLDNPAVRVNPAEDIIEFRGKRVLFPAKDVTCLILYKTAGMVTSTGDPHHRKTVYDLLPQAEKGKRWLYVGRLDKNTDGLLLFTDSGELVHSLSHPSFKVGKHYRAEVAGHPEARDVQKLRRGFEVDGCMMSVDRARILKSETKTTILEIILHHGEKRQIRRMLGELGFRVISLCRTRFGPLTLKGLKPGETRKLSEEEIRNLWSAAGHKSK
jgi:23S rRNA pseudouridine2605 synthase